MPTDITRYNGIYGDHKARISHDYLQSQLIVPRQRLSNWGLKPHLHENLFQLFFSKPARPLSRPPSRWSCARPVWSSSRPIPCMASPSARR